MPAAGGGGTGRDGTGVPRAGRDGTGPTAGALLRKAPGRVIRYQRFPLGLVSARAVLRSEGGGEIKKKINKWILKKK